MRGGWSRAWVQRREQCVTSLQRSGQRIHRRATPKPCSSERIPREEARMVRLVLAIDEAILVRMGRLRSAAMTLAMKTFTRLGDALSWVFAALVLIAAGGQASRTGLRLGIAAALGAVLGVLCGGVTRMVL